MVISESGIVSPIFAKGGGNFPRVLPDFSPGFYKGKGFQIAPDKPCFLMGLNALEYFGFAQGSVPALISFCVGQASPPASSVKTPIQLIESKAGATMQFQ